MSSTPRKKQRREWPYRLSVTLLVWSSIAVTLFPVAGTYYNNWRGIQQANGAISTQSDPAVNTNWLAKARAYNASLPAGAVTDPWTGVDMTKTPQYKAYLAQLAETDVMARLRIPAIGVTVPVRHGTSEEVLDMGAGHMFGSSLPVGGAGTHSAISAHRGLTNMTAFDELPEVVVGDQFFLDVAGQTLAYRVTRIAVVVPTDTKQVLRAAGKDQVTLITCTPYGINSHRLLVTGDRIPLEQSNPADAQWQQTFDWRIQPWMRMRFGIAAGALLLWLGLVASWIREDRRRVRRRKALRAKEAAEARAGADAGAAKGSGA